MAGMEYGHARSGGLLRWGEREGGRERENDLYWFYGLCFRFSLKVLLALFWHRILVLDQFLSDLGSLFFGENKIYLFILKYIINTKQGMKTYIRFKE